MISSSPYGHKEILLAQY